MQHKTTIAAGLATLATAWAAPTRRVPNPAINLYNFSVATSNGCATAAVTAVPEPAALGVMVLGGMMLRRRRR